MSEPTHFLLNDRAVSSRAAPDTPLLSVLRDEFHLPGTKPGCREGDCGACTVLLGENTENGLHYLNFVSCLTPLANVQGRHVVTIEGINQSELTPVQQAMVDHGGQQCGYCTPGFVVSLTRFVLTDGPAQLETALSDMDGNICRCTGYNGIIRAAREVTGILNTRPETADRIAWAVEAGFLPAYFLHVEEQLAQLPQPELKRQDKTKPAVAGGTDVMVRRRWSGGTLPLQIMPNDGPRVWQDTGAMVLGANCTGTDLLNSRELLEALPGLPGYMRLVASTPIRNMGTVAGNLVNASPIGDYTIMLLALGAQLQLTDGEGGERALPLEAFYQGYKQLDLAPGERINTIRFTAAASLFNFEKVCKRTHLDIASVNTAVAIEVSDGIIQAVRVSAGGVAPVPLLLSRTSQWLSNRPFCENTFEQAGEVAQDEIAPISDVRGSERYKRLLLSRLLVAHFHQLEAQRAEAAA